MAALSAGAARKSRNRQSVRYGHYAVGTALKVYQGGLVAVSLSTGRAVAASATTSRKILGVATETKTGNTGGTVLCRVEWNAEWAFDPHTNLTKGFVGSTVAVSTDNDVTTFTQAGTALVRVSVGELVQYDSTSVVWIAVRNKSNSTAATSA